jgi:uncharacterized protein YbjT (DUF2867 family)
LTNRILVTGATGKTGRRLVSRLRKHDVVVSAASRTNRPDHILFDWARSETRQPALAGVQALYLIAPDLVEDPSAEIGEFLEVAHQSGVRRVVAVSSLGVTFPAEPATSGRLRVEATVRASGLDWTILRPSGFYQNFSEGFFTPGVQAGMVQTATATGKAAMIDADDIAAVAALALTEPGHEGQIHAITGPQAFSFPDAVDIIARTTGRSIGYAALEAAEFRSLMLGFGLPPLYADMIVRDQIAIRDGFAAEITDTVPRLTGRPAASFAEFAAGAFGRVAGVS